MGQSNGKSGKESEKLSNRLSKVTLNDLKDANGLILQGRQIPEEILVSILDYVDSNSLYDCKFVCKRWCLLVHNILQKKIEKIVHHPPIDEPALWDVFYAIWGKYKPFDENLVKHNCLRHIWSSHGLDLKSWNFGSKDFIDEYSGHYMVIDDICWKQQDIYLHKKFPQYVLDNVKPTIIKIWDWYTCEDGKYDLKVELIKSVKRWEEGKNKRTKHIDDIVVDSFSFSKTFENVEKELGSWYQGRWYQVHHQFVSYEKGVNTVRFYHEAKKNVRIGGTTVTLEFPCRRKLKKLNKIE